MNPQIDRLLNRGTALEARGDRAGAEAAYREALKLDPKEPDTLQLLGGVMLAQGRAREAEQLLKQAAVAAPKAPLIQLNLAGALLMQGRHKPALKHAEAAHALAPNEPMILTQIARAAEALKDYPRAAQALSALPRLGAANVDSELRCAALYLAAGDVQAAEAAAQRAARFGQKPDETHSVLSLIAIERRDWRKLTAIARSWVSASAQNPKAHEMLARAHLESGDIFAAQETFRAVLELTETLDPEQALTYGRICLITQDFQTARTHLETAAQGLPGSSDAAFSLARLHTFLGNLEEARAACETAIERDPASVRAYVQLGTITRGDIGARHRKAMERLWHKREGAPEILSSLGFALGDVAHRAGERETAITCYQQANHLNAETYARDGAVYDHARQSAIVERIKQTFDAVDGSGVPAPADLPVQPIFIIGMPRSGTTLTESILAAHPDVIGAGEVLAGPRLLEDFLAKAGHDPQAALEANAALWRETYLKALPDTGSARYVTDKMPINFLGAGLLSWLFPQARFIHTQRNALDTGFSIFRHAFPRAYEWSHRLEDIGRFTRLYQDITAFFADRLGERLVTIPYEDIPKDPDGMIRHIVASAGLEWHEACLTFHEDRRAIATFSSVQVRSPISASSIGVADPYRAHLGPLIAALEG